MIPYQSLILTEADKAKLVRDGIIAYPKPLSEAEHLYNERSKYYRPGRGGQTYSMRKPKITSP